MLPPLPATVAAVAAATIAASQGFFLARGQGRGQGRGRGTLRTSPRTRNTPPHSTQKKSHGTTTNIAGDNNKHQTNRRTSQLLDQIGPVGRFGENSKNSENSNYYSSYIVIVIRKHTHQALIRFYKHLWFWSF